MPQPMIESEGKLARVRSGLPYFAEVRVRVEAGAGNVAVACAGAGFTSQGSFEDAPAVGYEEWKAGAVAGVRYALAHARNTAVDVTITRITGLSTDTNPSIVGAAAALATWNALGFTPAPAEWARVESIVFGSWQRPLDEVPPFA
jgi:hypothetical protein